jgi:CHAT domain-containing protein
VESELTQSIQLAQQTNQPALQALGLLHLALVLAAQPYYPAAQSALKQSIQLAQQHHLGYQPLRLSNAELEEMLTFYPHQPHRQLKGVEFTINQLKQNLNNAPITLLHLFSHAQFAPDLKNTFIVTYDDKLNISQLEELIKISQYKEKALELITLSACETVNGDERAALGLSGVALKAGARSALATLWKAWDESAFHVTSGFYQHLQQFPSASKAQSLQAAQKYLLTSQYKHTHYWGPFILIGNLL